MVVEPIQAIRHWKTSEKKKMKMKNILSELRNKQKLTSKIIECSGMFRCCNNGFFASAILPLLPCWHDTSNNDDADGW